MFAVAVLKGEIWAIGGADSHKNTLSSSEKLDSVTDTWIPSISLGLIQHASWDAVGRERVSDSSSTEHLDAVTKLWAFGGKSDHGAIFRFLNCERLDASINAWVSAPDLRVPTLPSFCCVAK